MRLPKAPDLRPWRRLLLTALITTLIVSVMMIVRDAHGLRLSYGDTDDAMRLVLARQLLNGRGWWDQHLMMLQPPMGLYMHWSRLLDGGVALMQRLFALALSWPDAEALTRVVWPLAWIFPAVAAMLLVARRLAGAILGMNVSLAIMGCAVLMGSHTPLYEQFHPGRVDHHDAQMTLFFLAFAFAVQRGPKLWGPALAGVATGLGVAIGLEALVFEAVIGAAIAMHFVFEANARRAVRAYALGLLLSTVLAFAIQTPPWRWGVVACDAVAFNLVAGIVAAGLGLIAATALTPRRPPWIRFAALGVAGAVAAGVYLLLDRNCIHGPFADVDPRIKSFWLDHVQEVAPWPLLYKRHSDEALALAIPVVLGAVSWLWLGRTRAQRQDAAWRLSGVLLLMTGAAGFAMIRAGGYAVWVAMPLIAVAAADISARYAKAGALAPLLAAAIVIQPGTPAAAIKAVAMGQSFVAHIQGKPFAAKKTPKKPDDFCFNSSSYRELAAAAPPGLVAAEIDLGPFVLALTPHAVLNAPYHRMTWGILADRALLTADADDTGPGGAEAKARALKVGYILDCPAHRGNADRDNIAPQSLQKMLDDNDWPDWLEQVSSDKAPIRVFRVLPAQATPARPG